MTLLFPFSLPLILELRIGFLGRRSTDMHSSRCGFLDFRFQPCVNSLVRLIIVAFIRLSFRPMLSAVAFRSGAILQ
jgi:hypothetical protein